MKSFSLLLSLVFLTSCSMYSSAGRKQFEDKAKNSIQSFALLGCRELSAAEAWLKAEFPSRNNELIEMHQDYEVWGHSLPQNRLEIAVYTKNENEKTESCVYHFESKQAWFDHKDAFLEELSRSLVNID